MLKNIGIMRHAPDTFLGARIQKCIEIIKEGVIGDVTGASMFMLCPGHEWVHPTPVFYYQEGAGPVLDNGPYFFRMMSAILGPVKKVTAMSKRTFQEKECVFGPNKGMKIP